MEMVTCASCSCWMRLKEVKKRRRSCWMGWGSRPCRREETSDSRIFPSEVLFRCSNLLSCSCSRKTSTIIRKYRFPYHRRFTLITARKNETSSNLGRHYTKKQTRVSVQLYTPNKHSKYMYKTHRVSLRSWPRFGESYIVIFVVRFFISHHIGSAESRELA